MQSLCAFLKFLHIYLSIKLNYIGKVASLSSEFLHTLLVNVYTCMNVLRIIILLLLSLWHSQFHFE